MRDQPEQHAERHAQADRDVGELGGRLHRVAEVLAQGGDRLAGAITPTRSPYSSTRSGAGKSTASPRRTSAIFADDAVREAAAARARVPTTAGRETKNRATSRAPRSFAMRPGSTRPSASRAFSSASGCPNEQDAVAGGEAGLRVGQPVRVPLADRDELDAGRQPRRSARRRCAPPGSSRVISSGWSGRRRRREPRLERAREKAKRHRIGPMTPNG